MYFCDSPTQRIQCCDYAADGNLGAPRTFVDLTGLEGDPDGSTVDAEGGLWNAQWGMSRVVRYRADGREDTVVPLPARQPTRPALGGAALDTLYITSARDGLSAATVRDEPRNGALFATPAPAGARGLAEARFGGNPSLR
jgi:L-arabinonolactonase